MALITIIMTARDSLAVLVEIADADGEALDLAGATVSAAAGALDVADLEAEAGDVTIVSATGGVAKVDFAAGALAAARRWRLQVWVAIGAEVHTVAEAEIKVAANVG